MSSAMLRCRAASTLRRRWLSRHKHDAPPLLVRHILMSLLKLAAAPFRYHPWRARHARLIGRDLFSKWSQPQYTHEDHLRAAIDWLCLAQDVRNDMPDAGGVAAGWSFEDGWLPSYPETSGYIVETFIAAAAAIKRPDLLDRASRIIDWELSLQRADGAFPGHFGEPGSQPVVFNTGQIMHGMLAGHLQLGRAGMSRSRGACGPLAGADPG